MATKVPQINGFNAQNNDSASAFDSFLYRLLQNSNLKLPDQIPGFVDRGLTVILWCSFFSSTVFRLSYLVCGMVRSRFQRSTSWISYNNVLVAVTFLNDVFVDIAVVVCFLNSLLQAACFQTKRRRRHLLLPPLDAPKSHQVTWKFPVSLTFWGPSSCSSCNCSC